MKVVLNKVATQRIKVSNLGGILTPDSGLTIRNQTNEINSIEDIRDVKVVDRSAGSTLVFNPVNERYEVDHLNASAIEGPFDLDGGSF